MLSENMIPLYGLKESKSIQQYEGTASVWEGIRPLIKATAFMDIKSW